MYDKFIELNNDLQDLIISKIYFTQPKKLLEDIRNYHKIKKNIIDFYIKYNISDNINDTYRVIEHDLCLYYNNYIPYSSEIAIENRNKLKRLFITKTKAKFSSVFYNFHFNFNIDTISRINRYIGCLNIKERELFFINFITNNYIYLY